MDRLMAEESWGTIVLDVDGGHVSLRQDWYYRWLIRPAPSPLREDIVGHGQWTEYVKEETHRAVQAQIRDAWERPVTLTVSGMGEVAQRLRGRTLTFSVDIRWTQNPFAHWTVDMWMMNEFFAFERRAHELKAPHFKHMFPRVNSATRTITLNLAALQAQVSEPEPPLRPRQQHAVAHEFGHTLGTTCRPRDEYRRSSPYYQDSWSIMHTGMEIRARHLQSLVEALHKLAPGAEFHVITSNTESR